MERTCEQAWLMGAHIVFAQQAISLERYGDDRIIRLRDGTELRARTVVLATGIKWRRLGVPRLEALVGSGVFYGAAVSESRAMREQDVFIVGAGNSAGQAASHLAKHARAVTLAVRGDGLENSMSNYLVRAIDSTPNVEVRPPHGGRRWRRRRASRMDRARGSRNRHGSEGRRRRAVRQGSIKRVASAGGEGATVVRLMHEHLRRYEPEPAAG